MTIRTPPSKKYEENFDRVFGKKPPPPPYASLYCGQQSARTSAPQDPPNYCHDGDHGECTE